MNIELQARDFHLTESLQQQVTQKLKIMLNRFGHKIRAARVVLSDINGPRGGRDKRCTIKIEVHNMKTLVIDEVTENMYESINRCASRTKRALAKLFTKQRTNLRESGFLLTTWTSDERYFLSESTTELAQQFEQDDEPASQNTLSA